MRTYIYLFFVILLAFISCTKEDDTANSGNTGNISGCTDPNALNYNSLATINDGSCCYISGCTDPNASNYDSGSTIDDGTCTYDNPFYYNQSQAQAFYYFLNATIDGVVQRRLTNELSKQKDELRLDRSVSEFRSKHEMNDTEWSEFKNFAENQSLSLDDIYFLKNRGATVKPSSGKATGPKVQQRPKSLATSGNTKVETSEESQIFDAILGIDKQLENAFG